MRLCVLPGLIALVVLKAPGGALAAQIELDGRTAAGERAQLTLDQRGRPVSVALRWSTACDREPARFSARAAALRLGKATSSSVRQTVVERDADDDGYENTVRSVVQAKRVKAPFAGGMAWAGTIRATAVVRREGRVVNRCRLKTLRWLVGRHEAALTVEGGPDALTAIPRPWTFSQRDSVLLISDRPAVFGASFTRPGEAPWHVTFGRPGQPRLVPGRDPSRALIVERPRAQCTYDGAENVIERVEYAQDGGVRLFSGTFTQACDNVNPPLRGRLTFRRGY